MRKSRIFLIVALTASISIIVSHLAADKESMEVARPTALTSVPGYQLSKKYRSQWALPKSLHEVSGIAVMDNQNLLIHQDESAVVFEFDLDSQEVIPRFQLGEPVLRLDIEGIALLREDVFLVTSNGEIYKVPNGVDRTGVIKDYVVFDTGLKEVCEIEGLDEDLLMGSLVVACKRMLDRDAEYISVYRFTPATEKTEILFNVSFSSVGHKVHASAIASQADGYVVLFGKERLIGHVDAQGSVIELQALKKKHHPQPEGIGFLKDGSLVLADEGKKGKGRITLYRAINDTALDTIDHTALDTMNDKHL